MKLIYTLAALSILALTSVASAHCGKCHNGDKKASKEKCDKAKCDKEKCDTAKCDKAGSTSFAVTGMTCGKCSAKLTKALEATEGVTVKNVCHKSGCVVVDIDTAKTDKTKVQTAINATGFKVAGEKLSYHVKGMTCGKCSTKLTAALTALEGCKVGKVCHKSGHADVTIDTAKTTEKKVIDAINATGFKVVTEEEKKAPAPSTAS